jgi:hypothetical protein
MKLSISALAFISQKSVEVGTRRTANRTHARKRAVSGLVIQITITILTGTKNDSLWILLI